MLTLLHILKLLQDSFIHLKFTSVLVGYCNPRFTDEAIKGPAMEAMVESGSTPGQCGSRARPPFCYSACAQLYCAQITGTGFLLSGNEQLLASLGRKH